MSVDNHLFVRELRVDGYTTARNTFATVKDACDFAATINPRDIFNRVLIIIQDGIYIEEPFTIPAYTTLKSYSAEGITNGSGVVLTRGVGGTYPSNETEFITGNVFSNLHGIGVITAQSMPANFASEFALIRASDGMQLQNCAISIGEYNGATQAYGYKQSGGGTTSNVFRNVTFGALGTGIITVQVQRQMGLYRCQFFGAPSIHIDLRHTSNAQVTSIIYCRLFGDLVRPNNKATVADIRTLAATTNVRMLGTRSPFARRLGPGDIQEIHATPRQLLIAQKMASKTVTPPYTINAFEDGTIRADTAGTVTLPALTDVGVGEIYTVKNVSGGVITIDGDGAETIDGAATSTITIFNDSENYQANDVGGWDII